MKGEEMKMKINSKNWIFKTIIFSVLLIFACLGVGATYSYFASKADKDLGAVTVGTLKLDGVTTTDEVQWSLPTTPIVPNQHIANVSLKANVKSNIPYYTRVIVGARVNPKEGSVHVTSEDKYCADYVENDVEILDIQIGDSLVEGAIQGESYQKATKPNLNGEYVYYKLNPTPVTDPLEAAHAETFALSIQLNDFVGEDFCTYYMEAEIKINVKVEVVQADYLQDANEGKQFDQADTMNATWEAVSPTEYDIDYFKGTFADSSWELIDAVARTGRANEVFKVGEEKTFFLTDDQDVTMVILGFNHDELSNGRGKAGITLGMKHAIRGSAMRGHGWDTSLMRNTTMKNYFDKLPEDLKPIIKTVNKKATAGSNSRQITTSEDKLWLLSVNEIWSENYFSDIYKQEGTQYEYYKNLIGDANPSVENGDLVKKSDNGHGSATICHLRSHYGEYSYYYLYSGRYGGEADNYEESASFCFCI